MELWELSMESWILSQQEVSMRHVLFLSCSLAVKTGSWQTRCYNNSSLFKGRLVSHTETVKKSIYKSLHFVWSAGTFFYDWHYVRICKSINYTCLDTPCINTISQWWWYQIRWCDINDHIKRFYSIIYINIWSIISMSLKYILLDF